MKPSWAPNAEQVHGVIPQRAGNGFSATSIPSQADVESVIEQICVEVVAEVDPFDAATVISGTGDDRQTLGQLARWCATLGAAAQVELGFFPEQQQLGDTSIGQVLYSRYKDALVRLNTKIDELATGDDGTDRLVTGSISTPLPSVVQRVSPDVVAR